jgi:hypothetical protein
MQVVFLDDEVPGPPSYLIVILDPQNESEYRPLWLREALVPELRRQGYDEVVGFLYPRPEGTDLTAGELLMRRNWLLNRADLILAWVPHDAPDDPRFAHDVGANCSNGRLFYAASDASGPKNRANQYRLVTAACDQAGCSYPNLEAMIAAAVGLLRIMSE